MNASTSARPALDDHRQDPRVLLGDRLVRRRAARPRPRPSRARPGCAARRSTRGRWPRAPGVGCRRCRRNARARPAISTSSSTGSTVVPATESTTDARLAGELVEQARLADVRLARAAPRGAGHDGSQRRLAARRAAPRRTRVEQVAASRGRAARRPAYGSPRPSDHSVAASASPRGRRPCWRPARTGFVGPPQHLDDVLVGVGGADRRVDARTGRRRRRVIARSAWAATCAAMPCASRSQPPVSTSSEPAAGPVGVVGHAVARDPGDVLDDGLAATEDAVDQRRLADVGPPDDRDDGQQLVVLVVEGGEVVDVEPERGERRRVELLVVAEVAEVRQDRRRRRGRRPRSPRRRPTRWRRRRNRSRRRRATGRPPRGRPSCRQWSRVAP